MSKKALRIFEIIWLIVTIFSFGAAIHRLIVSGWKDAGMLFIIFFISLLFYMYRRQGRKTAEKLK